MRCSFLLPISQQRLTRCLSSLSLAILITLPVFVQASTSTTDIMAFKSLIDKKDVSAAKQLLPRLQSSPVAEYANFLWLSQPQMSLLPEVIAHLQAYPQGGWSDSLKNTWADYLAQQQAWQTLRQYAWVFDKDNARCRVWQAHPKAGQSPDEDWYESVKTHWHSQLQTSPACQESHQYLMTSGQLTSADWESKSYFALSQDKPNLVQGWLPLMPTNLAKDLKSLLKALEQPASGVQPYLSAYRASLHHPTQDSKALQHLLIVLRQLIKTDPQTAYQHWQTLVTQASPHPLVRDPFERQLFWQLAKKDTDNALTWLKKIPNSQQDEASLTPIFNHAWQQNDWALLRETLALLPSSQQTQGRWQYWQARALQQLGQAEQAQPIWARLAQERSFYGFLAADRLNQPYQLNHKRVDPSLVQQVSQSPFLRQLKALHDADLKTVAWREWRYRVARGLVSLNDIPAFAQLALDWGWTDFSVLSMGNPQHWDYLDLRFPMPYRQLLTEQSQAHQIPLAWAYAITRRESAYNPDVTSRSGAMGLMQLMPKTAKGLATPTMPIKHKRDVYRPELNVHFGTKYLALKRQEFDQNYLLATAAYNAGAGRVRQWLKRHQGVETDQWVELIPFKETRDYVKAVLEYWQVFERLGNLEQTQLARYVVPLPTVSNASDTAQAQTMPDLDKATEATVQEATQAKAEESTPTSSGFRFPFADFF